MSIAQEEIFGPVLAIIEIDGYEEAIRVANDTPYGLSASIVTRDPDLMHRCVNDIESGTVKINRTTTGNLVNAPFGGIKRSRDRKSTRLNSSHVAISYAVFCLKLKQSTSNTQA